MKKKLFSQIYDCQNMIYDSLESVTYIGKCTKKQQTANITRRHSSEGGST